jgi:hypothetical protein
MTQVVHEPVAEKLEKSGDRFVYGGSPERVQYHTTVVGGTGGIPSETNTRARQTYRGFGVAAERFEGD